MRGGCFPPIKTGPRARKDTRTGASRKASTMQCDFFDLGKRSVSKTNLRYRHEASDGSGPVPTPRQAGHIEIVAGARSVFRVAQRRLA